MASPLLEAGAIDGAKGILINISGSSNLKLSEVNEASTLIQNAAHEEANIIFGAVLDESMGDEVKITVIATGFRQDLPSREESSRDVRSMKPEVPAFLNLDVRPAAPRFASEVVAETARASEPAAAAYASGFGSQSLATLESAPSFEPIATNIPAVKDRKAAALTPGGFGHRRLPRNPERGREPCPGAAARRRGGARRAGRPSIHAQGWTVVPSVTGPLAGSQTDLERAGFEKNPRKGVTHPTKA